MKPENMTPKVTVYTGGIKYVQCMGQVRMTDGRCQRCGARVESSGGRCYRLVEERS